MKFINLILSLTISFTAFAQKQKVYLEMDKEYKLYAQDKLLGVYEFNLGIRHQGATNIDYYSFVLNVDGQKTFEENGITIEKPNVITTNELKKREFCDIHNLFSDSELYLVKKVDGLYKVWSTIYNGTIRNAVRQKAQF